MTGHYRNNCNTFSAKVDFTWPIKKDILTHLQKKERKKIAPGIYVD